MVNDVLLTEIVPVKEPGELNPLKLVALADKLKACITNPLLTLLRLKEPFTEQEGTTKAEKLLVLDNVETPGSIV